MRVAVIGCGKMGGAMLRRWLEEGLVGRDAVVAVTATAAEARAVREALGVRCEIEARDALAGADLVLLAIKPQQVRALLPAWSAHVPAGQPWLSVLAGTPMAVLEQLLQGRARVSRAMPNTPAGVGRGATAICWAPDLDDQARAFQRRLLEGLGQVFEISESDMDAFAATAGSGPAYVYLFVEALAAAGVAQGLPAGTAESLALQVLAGAVALAQREGRPAAVLRAEVTSPGGMTEAALETLRARGWSDALAQAVSSAVARAGELARG